MSFTSKPLHQSHKMMRETKTKTKTKTTFVTTPPPKASKFRMMNQLELGGGHIITNNGPAGSGCGSESSSFRVLYYGDASAGRSIPFMWESHPGTPKHATTDQSTPPPLTPPPAAFHHQMNNEKDNIESPKPSLRTLFRTTSARKSHVAVSSSSDSSISYVWSKQSTSLRSLFLANSSSSRKVHMPSSSFSLPSTPGTTFGMEENGGASPTSTLCFGGGGFMKVYRRKKVKSVIGSHGKTHKKKFISF